MTRLEHLKQNWVIALIWNLQTAFVAFIVTRSITSQIYPNIFIPILSLLFFTDRDLRNWYTEERIDELEEEVKQLKDKTK